MFDSIANTFGGYVDKVEDVLTGVMDVDSFTVRAIVGHLEEAQRLMPSDKDVDEIDSVSFGTLPAGQEMGLHSTNAREFLMESLKEMLKTLGAYDQGVLAFQDSVIGADDLSNSELLRIARATDSGRFANRDDDERD